MPMCNFGRKSLIVLAFLLLPILAGFLLTGCYEKRLIKKQKEILEELQKYSAAYNRMIVWGDYDGASMAVVPEKRISFLEQAQQVAARVRIENFSIPLCQVGTEPFPQDKDLTGLTGEVKSKAAGLKHPKQMPDEPDRAVPPPVETVPVPEKPTVAGDPADTEKDKKAKKKKLPKVFYGVALVRYINMTVSPSATVRTRLVKQHWVYVDGTWMCDSDLGELLE